MAALFPRWSSTALALGAGLLASGGAGALLAAWFWVRTPYSSKRSDAPLQPLSFDHRHHVGDDGIDCLYCHSLARTGRYAGIPSSELCMGCHAQVWSSSPALALLRQSYFQNQPLVWRKVNDLPDFVHFDHSAHLAQGVECATCHGRVERMAKVYPENSLTMAWCLDCHRDPAPHLGDPASVTGLTLPVRVSAPRRPATPPLHCSGCHY